MLGGLLEEGFCGVLISNSSNIRYVAGYVADFAAALFTRDRAYYLTDSRFTLEAENYLDSGFTVVETTPQEIYIRICEFLPTSGHVAIDSDISYYDYKAIERGLRGYELVDVTERLVNMRVNKTEKEIDNIVRAQRIAESALAELLTTIKAGDSEREAAARLEYLMRVRGSDGVSFPSIVAFGENSAYAHAKPGDRRLKRGDIMLFDFGAKYNGYCSDMTRTYVYGECSQEIRRIYQAVLEANIAGCNAAIVGAKCRTVDGIARETLDKYGYKDKFTHSLGHGVGIDIHEEPRLSLRSEQILTEGAVVTIEPGVYVDGLGGVRIEDMVVCVEKSRNITEADKSFRIIDND